MLRDDDEFDPEYECPICSRSFGSYSSLDHHMTEHEQPRQCRNCGKMLAPNEYHRC